MRSSQLRSTNPNIPRRVRANQIQMPGRDLRTKAKRLLTILMCSISLLISADFISGYAGLRLIQQIIEEQTPVCKLNEPLLKKLTMPRVKDF